MPKATKSYTVKNTVHHDGEAYQAGDTIELADKHAAPLLAVKAIKESDAPDAKDDNPLAELLEENIATINADLPALKDGELVDLLKLEKSGKKRASLIEAIEALIEARKPKI